MRRAISLTGQYAAVDELQTGAENLRMMGRLRGLSGARAAAARRRAARALRPRRRRPTAASGTYSGGMRRRLDLAASLVGRAGGDLPRRADHRPGPAQPRRRCGTSSSELVGGGVTVFLTTQYLEEADRLADRIAVLDGGRDRRRGHGRPSSSSASPPAARPRDAPTDAFAAVLACSATARCTRPGGRTLGVATDGSAATCGRCSTSSIPTARRVARFAVHSATLDDVFLALTGHRSRRPMSGDRHV